MALPFLPDDGFAGVPAAWLPFAGFWALLFLFAAIETIAPLHRRPGESGARLVANFGLGVIDAALVALLPLSTVVAATWGAERGFGLFNYFDFPAALIFLATLAAISLASYAWHRLEHRVPFLWRFHRVHHSDTAIDLSTYFRGHPGARIIQFVWLGALTLALGLSAPAIALYAIVAGAFGLLTHANLRLPRRLERALRLVFVTPQMHHVHHSALQAETDSNFGDVLSIWDRLFGTHQDLDEAQVKAMRIGLGDAYDERASSLVGQLHLPLRDPSSQPATREPLEA